MFSVDNFYYILYKNLLESTRFSANYFYPFGTVQSENLCWNWNNHYTIHSDHYHTVLFYDQEPLFSNQLNIHVSNILECDIFCKLLANSEKSTVKTQLCRNHKFIDWYYFYHGFASLYWLQDFQYLPVDYQFTKVFISLNRLHTNYRSYRLNLISEYIKRDLVKHGHISFPIHNKEFGNYLTELDDPNTLLPKHKLNEIKYNLNSLKSPLIVDVANPQGFLSADCGTSALMMNHSSLWHIVSETIFYQDKLHLTEKIFKPIATRRPFILVGAQGNLAYLKSYGFKTFDKWINEDYDNEKDNDKRLMMVVDELEKLCKLSHNQLRDMHKEMLETLNYNYEHFYHKFKTTIVDELLDNFQTAVRVYNNLRFDDRNVPIDLIDFGNLRNLLLR